MQGQMSVSQMLVDEKHKKNDATELRRSAAASGFKREDGDPMVFGESGLLENEPTAPAEQAHTTQRQ